MPLVAGTRLAAYEILGALGAGGMGEVYRARDTRLRRDVAIKVLPKLFATDPDRLRRFEQEALATAALNHPNILAVYDVGREQDTAFVVEELLEGATLRDRLAPDSADGALSVRKTLDYAIQIANGLAAAHEKSIVHRDLKPENVFITRDERVKILDFGLAKSVPAPSAATSTGLAGGTEPGVVLGTVGYMAPEQVRGLPVDHRADLFSFGTILYEMLGGRRAFAGDTTADTMTAILKESPPDLIESGRAIPPGLARVVTRCLEKNPMLRFQSASDLSFALQTAGSDSRGSGATSSVAPLPPAAAAGLTARWPLLGAAVAAGAVVGVAGMVLWRPAAKPALAEPVRFSVSPADGVAIDDMTRAVVSPDGRYLALTEGAPGGRRLAVLALRDSSRRDLGLVAGIGTVCWSPDSEWLAYYATDRGLSKVSVTGTQRQRLAMLDWSPMAATWSVEGDIVVIVGLSNKVLAVASGGGAPREILPAGDGSRPWVSAQFLPDGNRLLLSRGYGAGAEVVLASLDGSRAPQVIGPGAYAQFVAPDLMVALRGNQLVAWHTRLDGTALSGDPVVLADGVLVRLGMIMMPFSVSQQGVLVYRTEIQESQTRIAWFDRAGREGAALKTTGHCRNPEFSPDFTRVAMECYESSGGRDIWVYDLARDAATRLTTDPADDADPLWTPDGRSILFGSSRRGAVDVFRIGSGGGTEELVVTTDGATPPMGLSPNGQELILLTAGPDLSIFKIGGTAGGIVPILKTPFSEIEGQFSLDGRYLLYSSNHSDRYEVYVEPWPQTGERWPISTEGGTEARWGPDGREIFYVTSDRRLMSVAIRTAGGFRADRPVELFRTRVAGPLGTGHRFPVAVAKDSQRFLMYVSDLDGPPPALTVITNWPALLKRAPGR